ncbi:MAG: CRISPR-associated helicase Cas3' [Oscillospiraceae bacterium]
MEMTAHIRETDGKEQSVFSHLEQTAALAEGYAGKIGMESFARLQGLLHDVGKLTQRFEEYIHGRGKDKRGDIDHSYSGAKLIYEIAVNSGDKDIVDALLCIARTIISHHGLHDWLDSEGNDYLSQRISKDEGYCEAKAAFLERYGNEFEKLLVQAAKEYSAIRAQIKSISRNAEDMAFYLGMLERLMESVLIDADRTDTADFMSNSHTENVYDVKKLWEDMSSKMSEKLKGFSNRTDKISLRRTDISNRCAAFADHKAGVCRLIVPTGGGKTLSSMRYAVECCKKYDMDRIFYIAPFMSILEQNSGEIRKLCGDEFFLEHHSNVLQDIDSADELNEYELRTEKWDKPVIAATMVQFLNALFLGKGTAVRRMHRLCRSVIIIDEVQSVPLKCVNLFNLAVNFLSKICGSTVVLCSATQPVFDRTAYPVIFDERKDMTGSYDEDFEVFRRTELVPKLTVGGYSFEEAADFCYERSLEKGSLLLVVNTKAAAAETFRIIKSKNDGADDKAYLLHLSTNMCPQHRKAVIEEARRRLDKHERVICVTTQLIEAGVDISFGCVVRSLAGMDNAAQAAGRCNRNGEINGVCPVYLINIKDENLGRLKEIQTAQGNSRLIIDSGKYDDLLHPEAREMYFRKLYDEEKNELSYNVTDGSTSDDLIDLLALDRNRFAVKGKQLKHLKYSAQAFKTAGEKFSVIGNETVGIIVPYNDEANDIILRLNSETDMNEFSMLTRKAQKYTVNVYENMIKRLSEAGALLELRSGTLAVKDGFYNDEVGITLEGTPPDALIF